jgi:N6-L-threonylcarbamoyladenine synthase
MLILALESSCDESSAAVLRDNVLLAVRTTTQTVHSHYGGVVPELAGRSHLELIDRMVTDAMSEAGVAKNDLSLVASTIGPGLVGSLLVGASYGRGLATALDIPFRGMHHVESHLWSAELTEGPLPLPFLVLLVSGGHTLLIMVEGVRRYRVLGSTLDDALGEAYDKVGKLMGLRFPAGADVDRLAAQGNPNAYLFPISMRDDSLDFSFSGLKTAFLYRLRSLPESSLIRETENLLASFQNAALKATVAKVAKAAEAHRPRALVAAGGVAANSVLRARLADLAQHLGIPACCPAIQFCGDNAAMIGYLAWKLDQAGIRANPLDSVRPRWPLESIMSEGGVA